jgi:CDGSH-type Zn-finger protein
MTQPKVADIRPIKLPVAAGTHYWCACGLSQGQPFCDGSHKGGTFAPLQFTLEVGKDASLCMCKLTKNPPYCDGSHKALQPPAPPVA